MKCFKLCYIRADELQCHSGHYIILMYSNPQYNPSSLYNAILQASINAISVIKMSVLHHKNVYSNPQYNLASLCIKGMLNLLPTDESGNL